MPHIPLFIISAVFALLGVSVYKGSKAPQKETTAERIRRENRHLVAKPKEKPNEGREVVKVRLNRRW